MFIVVSHNLEHYEDYRNDTILVCSNESDAQEAVHLLRAWLGRASMYTAKEWERFTYRDRTITDDSKNYDLTYDAYSKNVEPLPIQVSDCCFPNSTLTALDAEALDDAFTYHEVPFWTKD